MTSGSSAPAPTGEVSIESIEDLLDNALTIEQTLADIAAAREYLEAIASRPPRQSWSAVPSLVAFAGTYNRASAAIVAVLDQAELKIVSMAEAVRAFATEMQWQDQSVLDALSTMETKVDEALAPRPLPRPDLMTNGRISKTGMHQQPI